MTAERILVIDDESGVLRFCQRALQEKSFEVKGALSGEEGLRLLKGQSFDLTFLDIRLPDHDGLDVLSTIREMDSEMAVVIITGYGTMEMAIRALKGEPASQGSPAHFGGQQGLDVRSECRSPWPSKNARLRSSCPTRGR